MKSKKGQFFILSALIIVCILIGMYLFQNKVIETTYIKPRCDEFKQEISLTIDSCLYRGSDCSLELNEILDYIESADYRVEFCYKNIKRNYQGSCEDLEFNLTKQIGDNIYVCSP